MRMPPSCTATNHTSRCRQRRRTSNASTSPTVGRVQHPPGADARHAPQRRHQPRPDQPGQPPHHRIVDDRRPPPPGRAARGRRPPGSARPAPPRPPAIRRRWSAADRAAAGPPRLAAADCGDRTASRRVGWIGGALVGVDRSVGRSMAPPNPGTAASPAGRPCLLSCGLSRHRPRRAINRLQADTVVAH